MQIQRVLPPWHAASGLAGPHVFGEASVDFDADGLADVTDPAILDTMQQFPETFHVVAGGPEARAPSARDAVLDTMTVEELRELALERGLHDTHRWRKRELIEAIMEAEARTAQE